MSEVKKLDKGKAASSVLCGIFAVWCGIESHRFYVRGDNNEVLTRTTAAFEEYLPRIAKFDLNEIAAFMREGVHGERLAHCIYGDILRHTYRRGMDKPLDDAFLKNCFFREATNAAFIDRRNSYFAGFAAVAFAGISARLLYQTVAGFMRARKPARHAIPDH